MDYVQMPNPPDDLIQLGCLQIESETFSGPDWVFDCKTRLVNSKVTTVSQKPIGNSG
jgi:hypothetical protein